MTTTSSKQVRNLRKIAEEKYRITEAAALQPLTHGETNKLYHELQVHQIELEIQNEELRRSMADLESVRASYFDLYDLAPVGYLTLSSDGLILKANLAGASMLGVGRAFLLQRQINRFIFPEDQDIYCHHRKRLSDGSELQNWEMRLKRVDGSPFFAELRATLAHNGECRITLTDITQRKLLEAELNIRQAELAVRNDELGCAGKKAEMALDNMELLNRELTESNRLLTEVSRTKSDFLANMSHELRTPLNSVIGFSDVLQRETFGAINKKQQEYVSYILSSGKHLLTLINGVLDLSKVEAGKMELHLVDCDPREALTAALDMLKDNALNGKVNLQLALALGGEVSIRGDKTMLKQILYNLISNAIKFTLPGGSVSVSAMTKAEFIIITVADTGIGIKPNDIPKLFQLFTQLEPAHSKKFGGTGIGLTLTKQLVELHGGRIWLESEFGTGSSFSFTLPLSQVVTEESATKALTSHKTVPEMLLPALNTSGSVRPRKILVVEDNEYNRILLVDILSSRGYEVLEAVDGFEGVAQAKQQMPDLIIMDIQMPVMNGTIACGILKGDPATRCLKIIALTALAMQGDKEELIAAGFDDYLSKPINSDEISDLVMQWLEGETTV